MSTATAAPSVHLQTRGHVPPAELDYAIKKIAMALDAAQAPVLFVRAKLTALSEPAIEAPAIVQVNVNLNGRPVRAQAARSTFHEAIDEVQDRLRSRLRRADKDWEAVRGGLSDHDAQPGRSSSVPAAGPGRTPDPEGERQVWRHKAYTLGRITVDDAALELDILGYQFHLFAEQGSGMDSVLLHTADHGYDLQQVEPRPDRITAVGLDCAISSQPAPVLQVAEAMDHLVLSGRPFVFFRDAATGRGCVLYQRYDGHFGLVTPAPMS